MHQSEHMQAETKWPRMSKEGGAYLHGDRHHGLLGLTKRFSGNELTLQGDKWFKMRMVCSEYQAHDLGYSLSSHEICHMQALAFTLALHSAWYSA